MSSKELENQTQGDDGPDTTQQSFISHLIELRTRLLRALAFVFLVLLALMPFANELYLWLAEPLLVHMPGSSSMIATEVASPFLAPFKLALFVAFFISAPFCFYQAWAFVAPGLYLKEKRLALPLLVSSTLLFYSGTAFAYYAVFPLVFKFFTAAGPEGVAIMTDINSYLSFVLALFFGFGIAFEVPVATYLVVRTGISSVESLRVKRPYIIVGSFTLGMILTPPDLISQILLALPIWILYEIALILCRYTISTDDDLQEQDKTDAGDSSDSE